MKKLIPSTNSQTIKIIPRVYATSVTIKLRDDSTNSEVEITPTAIVNKNYLELSSVFTLIEGRFYDLKVYNGQDIIYRDKIFCTSQSTNQSNNEHYSVNKNEYVQEDGGNNHFIIL